MGKERLDHLWKVLSSATNIKNLEYDESVTIGSVFGEMRATIEQQQQEIDRYEAALNTLLTKTDWMSVEEVEEHIRKNMKQGNL